MKKTRKICSLAIALCLAVSLFVFPVSAAFSDVAGGRWYSESVDWASAAGYVSGYEDGTFRPDRSVTRAEFSVIMNRVLGLQNNTWGGIQNAISNPVSFQDVPATSWYGPAVRNCVRAGIIAGYDSEHFGPEDPVTRQQAAVILSRSYGLLKVGGRSRFADDGNIAEYAVGFVKSMVTAGYMTGMGSNMFQPKTDMTRAQMVTMLHAITQGKSGYQKLADHENINLLVVGDSISEGVGASSKSLAFADRLKVWLQDQYGCRVNLNNQALSGTASTYGYARTKLLDDQIPYDLIVVCYGHNDSELNFALYYEALLRALHTKYPHASMVAVAEHTQRDTSNNPSNKMRIMESLCSHYGVDIADIAMAFNAQKGRSLISSDGLHPNNDGHLIYAATIKSVVDQNAAARKGFQGRVTPVDRNVTQFDYITYFNKDQFQRSGDTYSMDVPSSQSGYVLVDTVLSTGINIVTVSMDNTSLRWSNGQVYSYDQKEFVPLGRGTANHTIKVNFAASLHADKFNGVMVCYGA